MDKLEFRKLDIKNQNFGVHTHAEIIINDRPFAETAEAYERVAADKGNRVFAHMNGALSYEGDEDELSEKIGTIREIHQSGLEVIHVIHRHGLDSDTVPV